MNSHPILIYIFSIYSIYHLFKSKSKNEFLILLTLFLFLLQLGSYPNRIEAVISNPINIRPMDIALIILLLFVFHHKFSRKKFGPIAFGEPLISYFIILSIVYTINGFIRYGYPAIAEFRSVLFFIVILLYVSVCIIKEEILLLIRNISTYLMPLILLVPLNLILTNNFSISVENRQFNAFIYETVTVGFLSGYLYYQYVDRNYKLPIRLFPFFLAMIPYCSHRTVWGIIFLTLPIILYWTRQNKYLIYAIVLGGGIAMYLQIDVSFFDQRLKAFTNIENDPTGSWRLLIWKTVINQATFFGNGLGSRFIVYAEKIGWQASTGAHNGFIQNLYYFGYIGLISTIILVVDFLIKFYKSIFSHKMNNEEVVILKLAFLSSISLTLYMFGYGPDLISWFYIGFALKLLYLNKIKNKINFRFLSKNFNRYSIL